jgi:hypothetical protein
MGLDFEEKMISVQIYTTRRSPRARAIPGKTAAIATTTAITLNTAAITADIAGSAPYSAETTAITANTTAITPITADIATNSAIAEIIARTEDIPNSAIITANRANIRVSLANPADGRHRAASRSTS